MSLSSGHGISSGDLNTGDNLSESSFLFLVPQILQIPTNLNLLGAGISQMLQMTQIFFASHLSPITIFRYKFDKMLIAKGFVCVTDGLKWGFIPHDFAYAVKQKGFFVIETGFTCIWSKLHLILK